MGVSEQCHTEIPTIMLVAYLYNIDHKKKYGFLIIEYAIEKQKFICAFFFLFLFHKMSDW